MVECSVAWAPSDHLLQSFKEVIVDVLKVKPPEKPNQRGKPRKVG